jgi:hypothetical protein
MIRELCTSGWITVDYWGCMAEVFKGVDPPGSTIWENFTASMHGGAAAVVQHTDETGSVVWTETSGRYILTIDNVAQMIHSLKEHQNDLQVMNDESLSRFEGWYNLCRKHSNFSVVYQIDF